MDSRECTLWDVFYRQEEDPEREIWLPRVMGGEEGEEEVRVSGEQREGSGRRGNAGSGRMLYKGLAAILSKRGDQRAFTRFKTVRHTSLGSQVLLWLRTLQFVWLAPSNMLGNRHAGLIRRLIYLGKNRDIRDKKRKTCKCL